MRNAHSHLDGAGCTTGCVGKYHKDMQSMFMGCSSGCAGQALRSHMECRVHAQVGEDWASKPKMDEHRVADEVALDQANRQWVTMD